MTDSRTRLLVVEDTLQHQELMLLTLSKAHPDWEIDAFWSGEQALETARQKEYSAAIVDFTLPGITGLEVTEGLRERVPDIPIVLVTARGSEKIAAEALRKGISEYLIKEGDYLELLPLAVSKAMETVTAQREREQMRKDLMRRTEELSALNAVATAVSGTLSVEDVLAEALDRSLDVLGAAAGAIYMVDSTRRRAMLDAYQGVDEETLAFMQTWRPSRTSLRRLMEPRRALTTLAEVFRLESPSDPDPRDLKTLEDYLAVPLKAGGSLMGLLCARPVQGLLFSMAEQKLLTALCRPISLAMANARLYQQTRQQLIELQDSQERLVAAARATAAQGLAQGITGEINNAMTTIRGSAQMIMREKGIPRGVETDALRILEGCERVMRLSHGLATMTEQPEGRRAPHSANRIVSSCIERLKASAEALNIANVSTLAPHLPTVSIEGDALEQALINVLINAIEAMPNGGELRVSTGLEGDYVCISVADTGEGIPAENLDRIFEPDFTTRRERGRVRGLGLGLFATRNIVQSRGGTISVRSEEGKGSTFVIRLPATRSVESAVGPESTAWSDSEEERLVREAGLVLNTRTRQVAVGQGRVEGLTKMESRLLEVFMTNPNTTLKRDFLMKEVWETDYVGDTRTLDVHVHWLRQKIEDSPSRPRLLRTLRGIGYRFGRAAAGKDHSELDFHLDFDLPGD